MLYLWEDPEYFANKHCAIYDDLISPNRYLFRKGKRLNPEEVSRCYCYYRSQTITLPDDIFLRFHTRPLFQSSYILTPTELFYCGIFDKKIEVSSEELDKLKKSLSLTDANIDKEPIFLTNQQLNFFSGIKGCPQFSRIPIFNLKVSKAEIAKFDCIPNTIMIPLINEKIIDLLLTLAPDDVQFFDTEVHCKDGILTNYKLLNITSNITGIDHERSVYSKILNTDTIMGFKYLTYKSGCMGTHKLARDKEYTSNLLVTEDIKQAFEKVKIKGTRFVRPEEYYRPLRPEDLID